MTGKMRSAAVTLVVVCIVLGLNWACPKCPETPIEPPEKAQAEESIEPTIVHDIEIGIVEGEEKAEMIKKKRVGRGEAMRITSSGSHAFVLIPDGELRTYDIGKNACENTDTWIACRVERGSGIGVYVPSDYRLDLVETEHTVWYSVLVWNGAKYLYQDGEKSPPKIIIPPGLPN